jgi:putative two-component system response regulator
MNPSPDWNEEMTLSIEEILLTPAAHPAPVGIHPAPDIPETDVTARDMAYRQLYRYAEDMRQLVRERAWALTELQNARRETLYRLAIVAEYNAVDGQAAMMRIGIHAALVAHTLGMPDDYCDLLCLAAPLRDIGQIGRGSLPGRGSGGGGTDPWEEHPIIGAAILGGSCSRELQMAEDVALNHHERYDGKGYPAGRSGSHIPLSGRIVAVVERLDKLLATHPEADAIRSLRRGAKLAFDPRVVEAAVQCAPLYARVVNCVTHALTTGAGYTQDALQVELWRRCLEPAVPG